MNQRSICLFLARKGLSARAVDNELTVVLGADAIADLTVTKSRRQREFTSILVDSPRNQRRSLFIKQLLMPLSIIRSIRELARPACIPVTTVQRHLTQSLGFVVKHLRWVPHTLSPIQKTERAIL
jgi:uncharacterized protein YueI